VQRYRLPIEPDQRRRLQFTAAALFAVTLLVAGLVVALRGDNDNALDASSSSTLTTRSEAAADDVGVFVTTSTRPPPPTTTAVKAAGAATTTTEADPGKELKCVHTTDSTATPQPDDWAKYWTTKPEPNEPLKLLVCVDDVSPADGQEVTLSVVADDNDAKIGEGDCDVHVDWTGDTPNTCRNDVVVTQQPQPTPAREKGHVQLTYTHRFTRTGESVVDVSVWSGPSDGKRYPYNSYNSVELQITVHK
jgi:hypothetical protein